MIVHKIIDDAFHYPKEKGFGKLLYDFFYPSGKDKVLVYEFKGKYQTVFLNQNKLIYENDSSHLDEMKIKVLDCKELDKTFEQLEKENIDCLKQIKNGMNEKTFKKTIEKFLHQVGLNKIDITLKNVSKNNHKMLYIIFQFVIYDIVFVKNISYLEKDLKNPKIKKLLNQFSLDE